MTTAAVEVVDQEPTGALSIIAGAYSRAQIDVVKNTVAKDATDDELAMFLRLADKYRLDPFAKEIWCICELDRDTGQRKEGKPAQIMASRDGYLAIANRDPAFAGLVSDAVYVGDTFERITNSMGMPMGVNHQYDFTARQARIIGAYALVYRHDRIAPTYYFARWSTYGERNAKQSAYSSWAKYPEAMIIKVAESVALRHAFSISGIAGEDEAVADVDERPSYVRHLAGLGQGAAVRRELAEAPAQSPRQAPVVEDEPATGAATASLEAESPPSTDSPSGDSSPSEESTVAGEDRPTASGPTDRTDADGYFPGPVTDTRLITDRQRRDLYQQLDALGEDVITRGDVGVLVGYATRLDDAGRTTRLQELTRTRYDQLAAALTTDADGVIREALAWLREVKAAGTTAAAEARQETLA